MMTSYSHIDQKWWCNSLHILTQVTHSGNENCDSFDQILDSGSYMINLLAMGCWWSLDLTHERENAIKEGGLVCLSTCVWETHAPEEARNGKFSVCSFALSSSVCLPKRGSGRGYSTFLSTFLRNSQAAAALKSTAKTCQGSKPRFPWWCHALSFKPWLFLLRQQENMESIVFIKHNDLSDPLPVIPRLFSHLPSPWW